MRSKMSTSPYSPDSAQMRLGAYFQTRLQDGQDEFTLEEIHDALGIPVINIKHIVSFYFPGLFDCDVRKKVIVAEGITFQDFRENMDILNNLVKYSTAERL